MQQDQKQRVCGYMSDDNIEEKPAKRKYKKREPKTEPALDSATVKMCQHLKRNGLNIAAIAASVECSQDAVAKALAKGYLWVVGRKAYRTKTSAGLKRS